MVFFDVEKGVHSGHLVADVVVVAVSLLVYDRVGARWCVRRIFDNFKSQGMC